MGKFTVADFFCGAGGFSEGFRQKGFDVVFSLDNWAPAKATHDLNHPDCKCVLMDILEIKTPQDIDRLVPDTDIIVGSPPCVSFSGSNKAGKADKSLGIKLIETYLRIVAWKLHKGTLKYWIMENVPNSRFYVKDEYTWKELELPGKGPNLKIPVREILVASDYGAPQGRKRFVCGNYPIPKKTHSESNFITTRKVLENLGNPNDAPLPKINDPVHNFKISSSDLTDHYYDTLVQEYEWKRAKQLKVDHGFMGKMDFPERLDRLSRTIMATMSSSTRESIIYEATKSGKHIGYRSPTIREASSMMGFPINYQFTGNNEGTKYKQIGNAVCVPMSAALAEAILIKEKKKIPEYIALPKRLPPVNLNGKNKLKKSPKPRATDAKFTMHIPNLKIRGVRVELSNGKSNFKTDNIVWTSLVHYGSGKSAKFVKIENEEIEKLLFGDKKFELFKSNIHKQFSSLRMTSKSLQESFILNGQSKTLNPHNALDLIKMAIDNTFGIGKCGDLLIKCNLNNFSRDEVPYLILAGAYACNYFISNLE